MVETKKLISQFKLINLYSIFNKINPKICQPIRGFNKYFILFKGIEKTNRISRFGNPMISSKSGLYDKVIIIEKNFNIKKTSIFDKFDKFPLINFSYIHNFNENSENLTFKNLNSIKDCFPLISTQNQFFYIYNSSLDKKNKECLIEQRLNKIILKGSQRFKKTNINNNLVNF